MAGRREKYYSLPQSVTKIMVTITIGIFLGFFCSSFFPYGFSSSASKTQNHTLSKSQANLCRCESMENIIKLRSNNVNLLEKNAELAKQIEGLNVKLQFAEQERAHAKEQFLSSGRDSSKTDLLIRGDESVNPTLAKILAEVSINKELIVALANSKVIPMLEFWLTNIKRVGIRNYLVVAVDEGVEEFCNSNGVPVYTNIDTIGMRGGSHTVSSMKYRVLRDFLLLGYNVLLSDIDIVYLQNPFDHLYRDSDVESMSDGHDNKTTYGYNDVFDDPSMGRYSRHAFTRRIWVYNSGFFYIRPTNPSIELMNRVANRLANERNAWDQALFNEELFHPSHPGYIGLHVSKRTMDLYLFMNTKVLFKTVRHDPTLRKLKPVIVHANYHHSDKLLRMKAVVEFYVNGKQDALDPFPQASPM